MRTGLVVECRDVVRIYASAGVEVQALQGLTLEVAAGEALAVVGASGSGKSTLLRILAGLDRPTAGSVRVAGHDLLSMGGRERMRYRRHVVGYVWQQPSDNLLPRLTVAENVALPLALAGRPRRERPGRVAELLDALGIADLAGREPGHLSGGQQQRAAIAVALANAPAVLLADEPTGSLDETSTAEVMAALRAVNERLGVTVLVVTHDPAVSAQIRRTVRIRDGRRSSEVHRKTAQADGSDGPDGLGASAPRPGEEYVVLDRVGRLQLPEEFLERLALRDLVRLGLEPDHVTVHPVPPPDGEVGGQGGQVGQGGGGRHRGTEGDAS